MFRKLILRLGPMWLTGAVLVSVLTSFAQNPLDPSNLIHQGDLIEVDVLGGVEYDWRGRLNPEGFLEGFQSANDPLFARCLSPEALAAGVAKAVSGVLKSPEVIVRILDRSGRAAATVTGAVRNPQRYQIRRSVNLVEILVLSGGLTFQTGGEIRLFRPPGAGCDGSSVQASGNEGSFRYILITDLLEGRADANPTIIAGDIITVAEALPVYVIGGVRNPRPVQFRPGMLLTQAIDSAGGLSEDGVENDILVIRAATGERILADLKTIRSKASNDIEIRGRDIVDVGRRGRERRIPQSNDFLLESSADSSKLPVRVID